MELTCSCAQMKAENMKFSKMVLLFQKGALGSEILASKDKRAFFWNTLYERNKIKNLPKSVIEFLQFDTSNPGVTSCCPDDKWG